MQALELEPLELVIPGSYYDSQIYNGRLYLWKADSSIITIDWNKLIEIIRVSEELKVAFALGFQYGDNLYNNLLLKDAEIKSMIVEKFKLLSKKTIEVSQKTLDNCTVSEENNPLPFPHADSSIHYKTIYIGSKSGVSSSPCNIGSSDAKAIKLWDSPVLSLSASHLTLAMAAGSEGLFDYSLKQNYYEKHSEPCRISEKHSNFARWLYPSIFSSSYFNEGCLADFKVKNKIKSNQQLNQSQEESRVKKSAITARNISLIEKNEGRIQKREFQKNFSSSEIFANRINNEPLKFTWGSYDKICLLTENHIELVRYYPRAKNETKKFVNLGSVKIQNSIGDIISADSSFFGIVLEAEESLLVVNSRLEHKHFGGEPVNWRVFPRSRNYTNQLHIIYDDSLHIYSFTHDYFVNQQSKKIGMAFTTK
ncbi:MAG: hypothetical protein F6K31_04465 [Symploca sp. SIO2G7]|nr:hypothetical protein [Symploca sp. SIO2G7]